MADNGKFFEPLAIAVAGGSSIRDGVVAVGCSERTGYRLAAGESFRQRVHALRTEATFQAVGKLVAASSKAADTLVALLGESNEASTRLAAAKAILSQLLPLSEHFELRSRIDAMEANQASRGRTP